MVNAETREPVWSDACLDMDGIAFPGARVENKQVRTFTNCYNSTSFLRKRTPDIIPL